MKKLKPNIYAILKECIEIGINAGYRRAFKHIDNPSEEIIKEEILKYVILEIVEKFNFDDQKEKNL